MSRLNLASPLEIGAEVDRYVIDRVLGQGGMGVVYRLKHKTLHSYAALKVVTAASRQLRERLLAEGRAQSRLRHPNVVQVTDVLDLSGQPGVIMEYVSGPGDLGVVLGRGPLTLQQVDALVEGILDGVQAAHAFGLVHRDLKPENILLAQTTTGIVPKVADFGLVMDENADMRRTRSGIMLGTPAFMAPEQLRNAKRVDQRADIWALGAILYEMIAGQRPFPDQDMVELFANIAAARRTPLVKLAPSTPPRMLEAVRGALVADPAHRIPDVPTLRAIWTGQVPWTKGSTSVQQDDLWAGLRAGVSTSGEEPAEEQTQTLYAPIDRTVPSDHTIARRPTRHSVTTAPIPEEEEPTAEVPVPAPAPTPQKRRTGLVIGLLGVLLLIGVGAVGTVVVALDAVVGALSPVDEPEAAALTVPEEPEPVPEEPTDPPVEAPIAEEPAPAPIEEPAAQPAPPEPAPVVADDPPAPEADDPPAEEPPEPAAAPPEVTMGRIKIDDRAGGVRLTFSGSAGRFSPGELPTGVYQGRAIFPDGTDITIDNIPVIDGETTLLRCIGEAGLCTIIE